MGLITMQFYDRLDVIMMCHGMAVSVCPRDQRVHPEEK